MTIEVMVAGGSVIAVPAVHYHLVFAQAVRQAFMESSKPAAVAVELGPSAAGNLTDWIRELSNDPQYPHGLPCMLGLIRANRRIHPKFKAASLRLQEIHGAPLHEVSPRLLRQNLQYAAISLLCLSATDSIIEATRCAVQYDIPIYGIDIEDFAACERKQILVEDPIAAGYDLRAFVKRNAEHCEASRDPLIDGRRERVMASRLKKLVQVHGRVLFTGGLAHWTELQRLLREPDVPAAASTPASGDIPYTKVVVDPAIAVYHMDSLPDYTPYYENVRASDPRSMGARLDVTHETLSKIVLAYRQATVDADGRSDGIAQERFHSFMLYLNNLCLLRQQVVPDLSCALAAAAAVISKDFAERLGRELIAAPQIRWLQPEDIPDIPYLRAVPFAPEEHNLARNCHKAELVRPGEQHGPFFVDGIGDTDRNSTIEITSYFEKPDQEVENPDSDTSNRPSWIWPPCENLFYGTAYHVAENSHTQSRRAASEPFAGALHEGINIKATLRAATRRENRVYVKVAARGRPLSLREALSDPFVYIFERTQRNRSMDSVDWHVLLAGRVREHHFRTKEARQQFRSVQEDRGDDFVASVHFCETHEPPAAMAACQMIEGLRVLWGSVAFGNPCLNIQQCARWLEEGKFNCCPVLNVGTMSALVSMYEHSLAITLDLYDWQETLVRIAIQYARHRVLIIAPDRSALTQRARMEARQRHVSLDMVPLSFISADRISGIRNQYCVYPNDEGAMHWSPSVIELLGPSDADVELLPTWIRSQASDNG